MAGLVIPEICGAMLLPDTVLFPQGALPLNIFEKRYRRMLTEAQQGNPVFAIFNRTADEDPGDYASCTAEIGTIGLIRASQLQENGTSELLLHGFMRVKALEWIYDRPYPRVRIAPHLLDDEPAADNLDLMDDLRSAVRAAISPLSEETKQYLETQIVAADNSQLLSDVIAQQFIQDATIRQALLDEADTEKRLRILIALLSGNQ